MDTGMGPGPERRVADRRGAGTAGPVPVVPGYDLREVLGQGAAGRVWSATRVADGVRVAVKVVTLRDDDAADRVSRELSVLAGTAVEGVVGFREAVGLDTDPPALAIVLDLAAGGSLTRAVGARGHLSVGEAVTVLAPVARALAGLHAAGVIHGDVSPGNVLLELSGRPLLADVGVACLLGERPGEVHGTEGFVAPEVLDGAAPSVASDVYAVGALAWWCVTGAPPEHAVLRRPLAQLAPGLPAAFLEWTVRAMSSDPGRRPDAAELALGYFDAAACAPLRLVVGSDETSLLTRRVRESADRAGATDRAAGPPRQARGGRSATRAATRVATRRRVRRKGLAVAVLLGAPLAGVTVATVGHSWPGLPSGRDGSGAVSGPRHSGAIDSTPAPQASSSAPQASSSAPRASSPSTRGDVATDRAAPERDPRALMQSLADQRARVMNAGSGTDLGRLDVEGSAAMTADESVVRGLEAAGERYRDVRLSVRSARLVSAPGDTVEVQSVVDTSAHAVVDASGGTVSRAPVPGSPMVFTLQWGAGRWRVASVESLR